MPPAAAVDGACRQWLIDMEIPLLIENGLRELVETRPKDPALFLHQYFGKVVADRQAPQQQQQQQQPAGPKKKKGIKVETEVPTPERMNETTLAALLKGGRSKIAVVDVRTEIKGGHIVGSVHVPCDEVLQDPAAAAARWAECEAVVFVSTQSPDLDQAAAGPVLQTLRESGSRADVFILMSGLRGWMAEHSGNPALVEGYSPEVWGRPAAPAPAKGGKKRKGPKIEQIDVPDAPDCMNPATLAVLLQQESTGTVVVDVRMENTGGRIPNSEHIPCDDFVREAAAYAERWRDRDAVVFASVQSPDLDLEAATALMQALRDGGAKAPVFLLSGGLRGWCHDYAGDEKLLVDFDPRPWGMSGSSGGGGGDAAEADQPVRGRKSIRKKKLGAPMKISVPEAPQKMAAAELATLLRGEATSPKRGSDKPLVVIDVRETQDGGRIPGSEHIPCETILKGLADYADQWEDREALVFVSLQSPDLDAAAATPLMQMMHERGDSVEVFVLAEGLIGWMQANSSDPLLVTDYDPARWAHDEGSRQESPSSASKRKKGPKMAIAVPEAPDTMAPSELALLVRARSEGCVVVDVRVSQTGGTIPGSVHIAHDELVRDAARHAADWAGKDQVVCVSALSPDIDQTAATALMQQFADSGADVNVFILGGGLRSWVAANHGDAQLVADYDAAAWPKQAT
eukprot:TRINITY_DN4865_c1_g1_i1.p1 TRINITY_DN4865_c1_g1~~TRINITY_DN4865_c1_g1_i1.p1  ORF type:complete len:712 (+),score=226.62 TRINITY_DN4865_c1_g1_i1:83-2137(+)